MKVYRTITENTKGRIRDEKSPTGYVRRVGQEVSDRLDEKGRKQKVVTAVLEPCEAPKTAVYGEQDFRGGTINTVFEDVEPAEVLLTEDEIRYLVSRYVDQASAAASLLLGGTDQRYEGYTAVQAIRLLESARAAAKRFGADLDVPSITKHVLDPA